MHERHRVEDIRRDGVRGSNSPYRQRSGVDPREHREWSYGMIVTPVLPVISAPSGPAFAWICPGQTPTVLAWKLPEFEVFPPPEAPVTHVIVVVTTFPSASLAVAVYCVLLPLTTVALAGVIVTVVTGPAVTLTV